MLFDIQHKSDVPIYEQIVSGVIFAIASGDLEPGRLIPSVRELAPQLLVHPNTVARAFQELERLGVLEAKRGRGMEVTPRAPSSCRSQRQDIIRARIRDALRAAVASALPADDIRKLVEEELTRVNGHRFKKS
jgi:GntR family transcriptional regulator